MEKTNCPFEYWKVPHLPTAEGASWNPRKASGQNGDAVLSLQLCGSAAQADLLPAVPLSVYGC